LKREYDGSIRSSSVATVAFDLLERGILDQLRSESKERLVLDKHYKLYVMRSSRSVEPQTVHLERDSRGLVVVQSIHNGRQIVKDSPIDCPEYTIFFLSLDYAANDRSISKKTFPKLFEEVTVGYAKSGDKGEYAKSLFGFKNQHLPFFRRSFAFILSIKRNRRRLLAYNWSANLFKRTSIKLQEMQNSSLKTVVDTAVALQNRSLGRLAPFPTAPALEMSKPVMQRTSSFGRNRIESSSDLSGPDSSDAAHRGAPPLPLPTPMIRRPKLVGKSVEGSAIQAVARSRARASSTRFRGANVPTAMARPPSGVSRGGRSPSPQVQNRKRVEHTDAGHRGENRNEKQVDEKLAEARRQVELVSQRNELTRHASMLTVHQSLMMKHWKSKPSRVMSIPLAEYLMSHGLLAWNDVSAMLPLAEKHQEAFLISFGQSMIASTPDLVMLESQPPSENVSSVILVGKSRNVRHCKGIVAIRVSTSIVGPRENRRMVVSSEGRILIIPRRAKIPKRHGSAQATIEYCSAGMDKLASDLHAAVRLQSKLFDHAASVIEQSLNTNASHDEFSGSFTLLQSLVDMQPRKFVVLSSPSNYKVRGKNIDILCIVLARNFASDPILFFIGLFFHSAMRRRLSYDPTATSSLTCSTDHRYAGGWQNQRPVGTLSIAEKGFVFLKSC
jgi:hypothetical protein